MKTTRTITIGLISKKQLCTCSTLFCTFLTRCYPRLQRETSRYFLVSRFMEEVLYVSLFTFFFFTASHFHLCGRWHLSFSHRRCKIFAFFFRRNWSSLFFSYRPSSFSVILVKRHSNSIKEDSALLLLLFFLSPKVGVTMRFTSETRWVLEMQNFTRA